MASPTVCSVHGSGQDPVTVPAGIVAAKIYCQACYLAMVAASCQELTES